MSPSILADLMIDTYALSLLLLFVEGSGWKWKGARSANAFRVGEVLLLMVWLMQTAYLIDGFMGKRLVYSFTIYGSFFLFSWLLVALTLGINRFIRLPLLTFWVNVFGFVALALHLVRQAGRTPVGGTWDMSDGLLAVHIVLSVGSYAAFLISGVLSGFYLFLHHRLKRKSWTTAMKRMPSLEMLDRYTFRSVLIGMPMLLLAMLLGIAWLGLAGETPFLWDAKVLNSIFILAAYGLYLIQRLWRRVPGLRLAWWNVSAFGLVLINVWASNAISEFHQWMWM